MNKSQDELNKIKAANPEKWQQLVSAGFKPQRIAEIIELHAKEAAELLLQNPPEKQAQARAASAAAVVRTHLERAELAKGEYDKLVADLRAQFPEVEFEVITVGHSTDAAQTDELIRKLEAAESLLATACKDAADLEKARDELVKEGLKLAQERDQALGDLDACKGVNTALQTRIANAKAAKSLKAAHDALE